MKRGGKWNEGAGEEGGQREKGARGVGWVEGPLTGARRGPYQPLRLLRPARVRDIDSRLLLATDIGATCTRPMPDGSGGRRWCGCRSRPSLLQVHADGGSLHVSMSHGTIEPPAAVHPTPASPSYP